MGDTLIQVAEGSLGAGKTYWAVTEIMGHLATGGRCFTNIEIVWEAVVLYVREKWGVEIVREQLVILDQVQVKAFVDHIAAGSSGSPTLVVLDEIHLEFNSRDWGKVERKILEFLTQVRKFDVNLILLSQDIMNIDKQFRRMVQYRWVFRDIQKLNAPLISRLPLMSQTRWDARSDKLAPKHRWLRKDKRVFAAYNSKAIFRDFGLTRLDGLKLQRTKRGLGWWAYRVTGWCGWGAVCWAVVIFAMSFFQAPEASAGPAPSPVLEVREAKLEQREPVREVRGWMNLQGRVWYTLTEDGHTVGVFPVRDRLAIGREGLVHDGKVYLYAKYMFGQP